MSAAAQLSTAQRFALRLAAQSGTLRRLPGGYWLGAEWPWDAGPPRPALPGTNYAQTRTIDALVDRGFLAREGKHFARLTAPGREWLNTHKGE